MSALQQIIKTGEAQNLSKEDIQAQLDAKKQEFKGVKTSTTPKSPGVDTENFSGSELDDYFSDSVTEKNAAEPWLNEKPKQTDGPKNATGDDAVKDRARQNIRENPGAYGEREIEFMDEYNPEGLDYDQFKAKLDEQYASRGMTPSGLLSVLDGLKTKEANQKKAIKGYDDLKISLNSISEESYNDSFINDYFDLENRPVYEEFESNRDVRFSQVVEKKQDIEEYLGPEKYKQYLDIQNQKRNGEPLELTPYSDYNQAKLDELKGVSAQNLRRKTLEFGLRGYKDEKVQGWIEQLVDKNRPYESVEEANESLELSRKAIVQTNIDNDANYEAFEKGRGGQIRNKLLEINSSAKEIINRTEDGNLQNATEEDKLKYKQLQEENAALISEYNNGDFQNVLDSIVSTQENNQFLISEYKNKVKDFNDAQLLDKALALDYSFGARAAQNLEEFFIGDGLVGFGSLGAEALLRIGKAVGEGMDNSGKGVPSIDKAINTIKEYTVNYNQRLAAKREQNIPETLKWNDLSSNDSIGITDYFGEAFANNSASILTTFIPGGAALKGASLVKGARAATWGGSQVVKKALQSQKQYALYGMRAAQGIFFAGESGGKFNDISMNEFYGEREIESLNLRLETATDPEEIKDIEEKINEVTPKTNYSFMQKALTSYSYGGIATYAETLGSLKLVTGVGNLAKKVGYNKFKKETYENMGKFQFARAVKASKAFGAGLGYGGAVELAEEGLTQIGHNAMDIIVLKEDKSLAEGLDIDFVLNTLTSVGAIMAPSLGGNVSNIFANEFRLRQDVLQTQKWTKEINDIQTKIQTLKKDGVHGNKKVRRDLVKQQEQLLMDLAIGDALNINKLKSLTSGQFTEALDLSRRMREVRREAGKLGQLGDDAVAKKQALDRLQNQYSTLDKSRNEILGTSKRQDKVKGKNIATQLQSEGRTVANLNMDYHLGIYRFAEDAAMTMMDKGGKFIKINTKNELGEDISEQAVEQLVDLYGYDQTTAEKLVSDVANSNGTVDGKNIIINDSMISSNIALSITDGDGQYAAMAPLEEVFHQYNKKIGLVYTSKDKLPKGKKIGDLKPQYKNAITQTQELLKNKKELNPELKKEIEALEARFNLYNENGKVDAEELLAQMNNAVLLGILTKNDFQYIPSLRNAINSISADVFGNEGWLFTMKNSSDVFQFINNYKAKVENRQFIGDTQEEDKVKDQAEIQKLSKSIGETLQAEITDPKTGELITQEEYNTTGWRKVYAQVAATDLLDKVIEKSIKSVKASKDVGFTADDTLYDQSIATVVEDVKLSKELENSIRRYRIGVGTIGGYIVTDLQNFRIGDTTNKLRDQPRSGSIDTPNSNTGATLAETLASDDTDFTENIDQEANIPVSKIKENAPDLISKDIEDDIRTAILEVGASVIPDVNSQEFLPFIKEVIAGKLTNKFKNKFGTRNQYDNFIAKIVPTLKRVMPVSYFKQIESDLKPEERQFTQPPVRLTKQKDIDKARENEQINYLENDAQGVNLYKLKKFSDKELANFFNPPPINPDTGKISNNKGNRKTALATAIAIEAGFDMIPSVFKGKMSEQDLAIVGLKITRDPRSKFQKSINAFIANDLLQSTDNDAAANARDWKKLISIYLERSDVKQMDNSTEAGRTRFKAALATYLAPRLPKEFFLTLAGTTENLVVNESDKDFIEKNKGTIAQETLNSLRDYTRQLAFKNVPEIKQWIKETQDSGVVFPSIDKFPRYKAMLDKEAYVYKKNKKKTEKLPGLLKNKDFNKKQDDSIDGLKDVFLAFQDIMKEGEGMAMVGALLESTSAYQGHFVRRSSPVRFFHKNYLAEGFVEEHTLPASLVSKYLFIQAAEGNIGKNFKYIKRNYFQGALTKAADNMLSGIGLDGKKFNYKDKTPGGWMFTDNVWARYFNANVANKDLGGIAPDQIVQSNGQTVFEQYNVNSAGYLIPLGMQKSSNQAAAKNTNTLPTVLKPAKNSPNQVVLNTMKDADNQAVEERRKLSKSVNLNKSFNDIIARNTGIESKKEYGRAKASVVGKDKGKFNLLGIPPSAQDFVGLLYKTLGKGKQGDADLKFYKDNLLDPFARAMIDISNARVALANDFKELKKLLKISPKDLNKKIPGEPFTVGNAIRVFTWTQQGMSVPGLSKADSKELNDYVLADKNLSNFANQLIAINKDNGYPKPQDSWLAGTITTDLLSGLDTIVRSKYLEQWQGNVDQMFSEANLNKLEAAYGKSYRDALENIIGRMKTGSNRGFKGDSLTGRFIDWINGSIGAIMFFNMRSAVLQTISAVNFVNFTDNNIFKAAAAFANQKQYWGDVVKLMNSDYLVERRNGLKINVNEADIAEIAAESKNKAKAFVNRLLKLGFLPTQIADSFAIASGGATFYRNRLKSLLKEGMSQKEAEAQAFQDFREIAEESQQSSRPDRISQQQAGPMGRIILAFANTPAQYARLIQKAASDLKNGRGDMKTNISKILYYGMIQNVIFNALQQALFAMAFDDEEADEEKKNKKYTGIVNGMADSLLRGAGFHGAAISTLKNVIMKLAEGAEAQDAAIEMLDISPAISSKISKLRSAGRTWDWNKKEIMEKGWSLDNPAYLASGQVVSAVTNIPLDRGIRKLQNLKEASNQENEEWQRVALALGWSKWELDWEKDKAKKKTGRTSSRTSSRKSSRKSTRN